MPYVIICVATFFLMNFLQVQVVAWNHHEPQVLLSGSFDRSVVMVMEIFVHYTVHNELIFCTFIKAINEQILDPSLLFVMSFH